VFWVGEGVFKKIIWIFVGVCFCSAQALAADTTWFCSALISKPDTKPTAFKFEVKGGELFDLNVWQNAWMKKWGIYEKEDVTKYKIVEDTDIGLVAAHGETSKKNNSTWSWIVLIDKVSGNFRQIGMPTKKI
jgi:hypothetical protein